MAGRVWHWAHPFQVGVKFNRVQVGLKVQVEHGSPAVPEMFQCFSEASSDWICSEDYEFECHRMSCNVIP